MTVARNAVPWPRIRPWLPCLAVGSLVVFVAAMPTALVPLAGAYAALCERYPILALLSNHTSPLPMALLLGLMTLALTVGIGTWLATFLVTARFNRRLRRGAIPVPARLERIAGDAGLVARLTYLAAAEPLACCYGFVRPRIAITAGLVERLDDEELVAALGHEREHLRRRDPLRYLVLEALTAAAFMFPVAPALRERAEARIELAADQAALTVAPRGALAGALLAALPAAPLRLPGVAGLTATEARIAHLAGRTTLPLIPAGAAAASLGFGAVVVLTTIDLAASVDLVRMMCPLCPWLS